MVDVKFDRPYLKSKDHLKIYNHRDVDTKFKSNDSRIILGTGRQRKMQDVKRTFGANYTMYRTRVSEFTPNTKTKQT